MNEIAANIWNYEEYIRCIVAKNIYRAAALVAHYNTLEWHIIKPHVLSNRIDLSLWYRIRLMVYVSSPRWWLTRQNKLFNENEVDDGILLEYVPALIKLNKLHKLAYPEHPIYNF
jgi:hypothetical protein